MNACSTADFGRGCLTGPGHGHNIISIFKCVAGDKAQHFVPQASVSEPGPIHATGDAYPHGECLALSSPPNNHCCKSGWVSQIDSQQDLTNDNLSGPGYWNDNDMLSVGCNSPGVNGTAGTPCAGYQSMVEQKSQFALWCVQASPLILGHDVTSMGPEVRAIITDKDMIALNQDPLGHRAAIAWQSDPYNRTLTIFVKKLASITSPRAAALFNRGAAAAQISLKYEQLSLDASANCGTVTFTDLDTKTKLPKKLSKGESLLVNVVSHGVVVLRAACA